MFRLAMAGVCSLMVMALSAPRNFNDEYRAGHMLYSIAEELENETRLNRDFPRTASQARSLKNSVSSGIIDVVLESGDHTRLHGRCAMIFYGDIAQESYDSVAQTFATEYRSSNSLPYKKVYRWMINRLREANDALQRAVNKRRGADCSPCLENGWFSGKC